jgi:GNAT acetyltransferase-like protein
MHWSADIGEPAPTPPLVSEWSDTQTGEDEASRQHSLSATVVGDMSYSPVTVTRPAPRAAWREILETDRAALLSQTPEWLDTICAVGGWKDASLLYAWRSGRRMVLPMVARGLADLSITEESLPPGWGFGGLVAASAPTVEEIDAVRTDLARHRAMEQRLSPNMLQGDMWRRALSTRETNMIVRRGHAIDLQGGIDSVWRRFKDAARRNVRTAERAGVTVECDTTGRLLDTFDELWLDSVRRWAEQEGEPVWIARDRGRRSDHPTRWRRIMERSAGSVAIWMASHGGRPVAGIIVLRGPNDHYTRGAMIKDLAGPTRANYLLHWLAIQDACGRNASWYQMGRSGRGDDGVGRFKENLGASAYEYPELHLKSTPLLAAGRQARAVLRRLIVTGTGLG